MTDGCKLGFYTWPIRIELALFFQTKKIGIISLFGFAIKLHLAPINIIDHLKKEKGNKIKKKKSKMPLKNKWEA